MSVSCAFSFGCSANSDVLLFILPYNISYCLKMPVCFLMRHRKGGAGVETILRIYFVTHKRKES